MRATNPEIQIEVERLSAILRETPIGAVASYDALSGSVGYSVQLKPFSLLRARKVVEEETGMRFATIRGEGVKKLEASAIPGIGASARRSVARKAKRHAARLAGLSYNDIEAPIQARIDAERSLLGAISAAARADVETVQKETRTGPIVAMRMFDMLRKAEK
jgi:hypothetical protein